MKTQKSKILLLALALATLGSGIQPASAASFVYTGSMHDGRWVHTATLLPNGNVLVAGGSPDLSSAELYQPDSDGGMPSLTILNNANQILSFTWNGLGTLEQAENLTAPNWQPTPIQDNPHTVSTSDPMKFFRMKAD